MRLAVEMDDTVRYEAYGKIHKQGCRDLVDPIALGDQRTLSGINFALESNLGSDWSVPEEELEHIREMLAPCARSAVRR